MNFTGDMVDLQMGIDCRLNNTPECLEELTLHINNFIEKHKNIKEKILQIGVNISGPRQPRRRIQLQHVQF